MITDQNFVDPTKIESSENSDYASSSEDGETGTSSSSQESSSISSYSSEDEISNREILSKRSLAPMDIDIPEKIQSMKNLSSLSKKEKHRKNKNILTGSLIF